MLNNLLVLDLTRHLPGPYASMILGDLGANVLKIEEPTNGDPVRWTPPMIDGTSVLFLQLNRNKKGLTLNLKSSEGREILFQLSRGADVLIESFRPGVTTRLGIDYSSLRRQNPKLVYCSISGYGQSGPDHDRAGHDINYIARSGLLGLNTDATGTPVIPPIQVADLASGAMLSLVGILAALLEREKSGEGKHIDVSMLDGTLALLQVCFSRFAGGASMAPGEKMELTGTAPFYNIYRAADGRFLAVGAIEPKFWENFCMAIGQPHLVSKQFASGDQCELVLDAVRTTLASRTQAEWMAAFAGADVCCEPVRSLEEAISDPQLLSRGMIREVQHPSGEMMNQLASPLKFSDSHEAPPRPAPSLGQHNNEVLSELGYSKTEISNLRSKGVI